MSTEKQQDIKETLRNAGRRALGGGLSGAAAMAIQVFTLMPLRTAMNYQYRHGSTLKETVSLLYKSGGLSRFYSGLGPALIQAPLSRFGDTASNVGALALLNSFESTRDLSPSIKTIAASLSAGAFRILLVPVDTVKTIMQVEGKGGWEALKNKVKLHGPTAPFHGALANASATAVGHYPWFAVYNTLTPYIKKRPTDSKFVELAQYAGVGFLASLTSDCITNSIRVIKTYRQTSFTSVSYPQAARNIIAKDGVMGLLGRGLKTRILANGLQGILFSVLWRTFQSMWNERESKRSQ